MNSELVSVCVPTYNGGRYLRECFDSLRAQTLTDFEVILADDASTDDTFAIAEEYARKDPRFRIHRNAQRLGMVGNWNRCVDLSRGKWIKNMAQDDTLEPRCLEALVNACERHQCLFGFCDRNFLFDDSTDPHVRAYLTRHQELVARNFSGAVDGAAFSKVCAYMPEINPVGEPVTVIFHRSVCEKYGKYNPLLIQLCDSEYWMRVASNTGAVRVPERLANFRVHGKSTTASNLARQKFRTGYLDPLVIRYLFMRDANFRNIRRAVYQQDGTFRAWWQFIHFANSVAAFARSQPANATGTVPEMEEWKKMQQALPGVSELALAGRMTTPFQQLLIRSGLTRWLRQLRGGDEQPR